MPNHILNQLNISGNEKQILKLREQIKGDDNNEKCEDDDILLIDFEKIIPMPETEKDNWYNWRLENWGTKWNAYHFVDEPSDHGFIQFDTAWSTPKPIIKKLSELYPTLTFYVEYADEDLGSNCGTYQYKNGKLLKETEEDLEFACNLQGLDYFVCEKCGEGSTDFRDEDDEKICDECKSNVWS